MTERSWTDEEKQAVRDMWNAGKGGTEIACVLGRARNGVLGLIYRLRAKGEDLPARATNFHAGRNRKSPGGAAKRRAKRERAGEAPKPPRQARPRAASTVARETPEAEVFRLDIPGNAGTLVDRQHLYKAIGQQNVPFIEANGCRWPGWSASEKTGTVCGLPVHKEGASWCEYHADIAWTAPPSPRERKSSLNYFPRLKMGA